MNYSKNTLLLLALIAPASAFTASKPAYVSSTALSDAAASTLGDAGLNAAIRREVSHAGRSQSEKGMFPNSRFNLSIIFSCS